MRIISPGYEILTPISEGGIEELQMIEKVGRTCYKSEDRITTDGESAKKFVRMLIEHHHEAMIEHGPSITVKFTVDRGISHEIVRHRVASYAQESTRYCNYTKEKFGSSINIIDIQGGIAIDPKTSNLSDDSIGRICNEWLTACAEAEKHYMKMVELGASPQIARSVLPHSTKTELVVKYNLREWRHFLRLRTAKDAHPQIREVTIPLLKELQKRIPVIFDDIEVK